jgi:hypothetical protein
MVGLAGQSPPLLLAAQAVAAESDSSMDLSMIGSLTARRGWTAALLVGALGASPLGAQVSDPDDSESADELATAALARVVPRPAALDAARQLGPIEIDGRLDEGEWAQGRVFTGFIQQEPIEGDPAEHDTEIRVLIGDDAIWIGARMWDPRPEGIDARLARRDAFGTADQIGFMVDPNRDGLTGYGFNVSAAGVQSDMYLYDDDRVDREWNAVWASAVEVDEFGWTAEMRVPLSQIRYEASDDPQTWGINFTRFRVANNERTYQALVSKLRRGLVGQMGTIDGVQVSDPSRRLEVVPYVVSSLHRGPSVDGDPFFDGSAANGRFGMDLSYGLGAAFTLDATINPDFGQVEADPAVINLSAFETFFPEQRPFFTEDARVFDFTLSGGRNQLFYSRRVGRSPQGRSPSGSLFSDAPDNATILGAAKLSGRTSSGLSIGALAAVTGSEHGEAVLSDGSPGDFLAEPRSEFGVVSIAKDFNGGASQIRGIGTALRRELPGDGSFDWLPSSAFNAGLRFDHQWNDREWRLYGFLAGSHVRGDEAAMTRIQQASNHYFQRPDATRLTLDPTRTSLSGLDWRLQLERQNAEHWTYSIWAAEVTSGFEINDVGFSTRSEVLDAGLRMGYREIQPGSVFRNYNISASTFHNWSHEALDDVFSIGSWHNARARGSYSLNTSGQFLNYWSIRASTSYNPQQMSRQATRGGPMMVGPASLNANFNVSTDQRKSVSAGLSFNIGDDRVGLGGRKSIGGMVRFQPSDNLSLSLGPNFGVSRSGDQYVTATSTLPYSPTYGVRYLFADIEQRSFSMETRVDWTFTPRLSLQLYAQPLLSSGDYLRYKQLAAAETFDFVDLMPTSVGNTQEVDFDGDASTDFTFTDRDFNVRSLVGNAVLRWEYRPGSTIFFVWQRQQADRALTGDFDLGRDAGALFGAPANNRFIVKVNYWLGL